MDLECPYCEAPLTVNHDDGFGYEENTLHQMSCPHCEKNFLFETIVHYHYEPQKADCLNDAFHTYEKTNTFPKELSKMQCTQCGDTREMTDDERSLYNIGSIQSYIDNLMRIPVHVLPKIALKTQNNHE